MGKLLLSGGRANADRWAGALVDEFGSIGGILAARPEAVARIVDDHDVIRFLGVISETLLESLRDDGLEGPIVSSAQALIDYLSTAMAHSDVEEIRVLYLNAANCLLRDEVIGRGAVGEALFCSRTILRRALEVGATGMILVHNHPSGNPAPSKADIYATERIVSAAKALDVLVHDHLVIGRGGWTSFRQLGLL